MRPSFLASLVALVAASCAHDSVLPVDAVCGDLKKDGAEECDVDSVGCVECHVVKGYTCDDQSCAPVCGDGILAEEEACDPPDGVSCDSSCQSATKEAACDATGFWIARLTTFSIDTILNQVQTASNWFAYGITQKGTAFAVDTSLFCGIHVSGSATVDLPEPGARGLLYVNAQGPSGNRPARGGTFVETDDGCEMTWDRFYFVRGLEDSFLPADFLAKKPLSSLPPLPVEPDPEHSTGEHSQGAVDVDGDGFPGVAFRLSGNATGVRNVAQRDWNEYATSADFTVPKNAIELTLGVTFDNEESILHVSRCPLVGCGVLLAGSTPATNLKHRITYRYLGQSLDDPRVSAVITRKLGQNEDDDFATCANVRAALPHDASKK